jgi:hypothetical protein
LPLPPPSLPFLFPLIFFSFSYFLLPFSIKITNNSFSITEHTTPDTNHISHNQIELVYISQITRFTTYLRHKIHNPFTSHKNPSHNLSKITINLMNVSRTSKNQQHEPVPVLPISVPPPGLAVTTPRASFLQIEREM